MYKWYITCGVLISCFVIAVVLFVISNLQNKTLIKKIVKDKDQAPVDYNGGYKCNLKKEEDGCYFEIIDSDGVILGASRAYRSNSSCINNATKLQDRLNLDIINNEENLIFGKYSIVIEKNDKGNYRFKIMSMKAVSFVSRYYDTEKELLIDIEKYKSKTKNQFMFIM